MPPRRPTPASALRWAAVVAITGLVWGLAACSDEDLVDTEPPPWPGATTAGATTAVATTAVEEPQDRPTSLLPQDLSTNVRTGQPDG